jgi:Na+/H+ antiporter NhaC
MSEYIVFLPGVVMVSYTLISRRIIEPLVISVALAYFIKYGFDFSEHFINGIYDTIMEESIAFLIVMLFLFGGLINIMKESRGVFALMLFMEKKIKSKRMSLIMTWLLGVSLFMDDYLNSLVVGTTMKKITDSFKVPREQLSIISITTSVPLCIVTPITTWAVFIFGVIKTTNLDTSAGQIGTYLKIIPYAIYPYVCVIGTFLMTIGIVPKVFRLKKAYERVEKNPIAVMACDDIQGIDRKQGHLLNFFLPIILLVVVTIITANIAYGIITSLFITMIWLKLSGQMNLSDFVDISIDGMGSMVMPLIFILFAFMFGNILTELGFAQIVLDAVGPYLGREVIPLICFWITAILVFSGVDVWAVIPLVLPILIPLANAYEVSQYMVIGTVFSGISLGAQLCFISESNILIASTIGLKPMDQVLALLPYALFYALVTSLIYLNMGVYM